EQEVDLWLGIVDGPDPRVGNRPLDPATDVDGAATYLEAVLPTDLTSRLLTVVTAAYSCGPDQGLLGVLAVAVAQWRRQRGITDGDDGTVLIDVEGHGREPLVEGLDLSRTVGWFTSIYPVRLPAGRLDWSDVTTGALALSEVLKGVKEEIRRLPDKGAGYGLLRYLNPHTGVLLAATGSPQIGFNYLGRFSDTMGTGPAAAADSDWGAAPESPGLGGLRNPQTPLSHLIEINASAVETSDGVRLRAVVGFPESAVPESAVRQLVDNWQAALTGLVRLVEQGGRGYTPSDFPLVTLSPEQLGKLEATYPELVDVLPLTPLQEGL